MRTSTIIRTSSMLIIFVFIIFTLLKDNLLYINLFEVKNYFKNIGSPGFKINLTTAKPFLYNLSDQATSNEILFTDVIHLFSLDFNRIQ